MTETTGSANSSSSGRSRSRSSAVLPNPPPPQQGASVIPSRPMAAVVAPRDMYNRQSLGHTSTGLVQHARVLMIGAGGIGCELLKNLVLTGFGHIEIVDLDTIDLSNLNRQFLFQHEHLKKPKALVAREAALRFRPGASIVAHHANIKDPPFGVGWYRQFGVVFNALDNVDARRHVNRMCLAADRPLIESGTTGFNGQCQVHRRGVTACYDCAPKMTPVTYPVCTIRSTPTQPIHCIVWAKSYLLPEMFGAREDDAVFDHGQDGENASEIAELKKEAAALRQIRESIGTPSFPRMLFNKVFKSDIERLLSMADMWKSRRPPEPLDYDTVMGRPDTAPAAAVLADGQRVWTLAENLVVFNDSVSRLSRRMISMRAAKDPSRDPSAENPSAENPSAKNASPEDGPVITFDKDDPDTLDFVTAGANIRSSLFGIETKSRFDIKQMAGNIIPAIATTNAIVAGLCVLEAFKVLRAEWDQSNADKLGAANLVERYSEVKEIFLSPFGSDRPVNSANHREPNPHCASCGVYYTTAGVDLARATLEDLVQDFVRTELGFGDKEISISSDDGLLYDVDETENLAAKLSDLGIRPDSFLTVIDDSDEQPVVNVILTLQELTPSSGSAAKPVRPVGPSVTHDIPARPAKKQEPGANTNGSGVGSVGQPQAAANGNANAAPVVANKKNVAKKKEYWDDYDRLIGLDMETAGKKRPRTDDTDCPGIKRAKTNSQTGDDSGGSGDTDDDDVVIVLDRLSSAINIDD